MSRNCIHIIQKITIAISNSAIQSLFLHDISGSIVSLILFRLLFCLLLDDCSSEILYDERLSVEQGVLAFNVYYARHSASQSQFVLRYVYMLFKTVQSQYRLEGVN